MKKLGTEEEKYHVLETEVIDNGIGISKER